MNTIAEAPPSEREKRFDWPLCYSAENLILGFIDAFLSRNGFARRLSERMRDETGSIMIDWVDHLVVSPSHETELRAAGFTDDPLGEAPSGKKVLWHPEAMLPRVLLAEADPSFPAMLAIHVDRLAEFLLAQGVSVPIEGEPLTRFRRAVIWQENGTSFEVIERRGYRGYLPAKPKPGAVEAFLQAEELWLTRQRSFSDEAAGYAQTQALIERLVVMVGRDLACHVVFAGERRNRAAQIQKARQDKLGLGWANNDHHTFRSSRRHFVDLMRALDSLGFERRERYYAGDQAGWGAQISEQPVEGVVSFCDVDLMPDEKEIDFSRRPLPEAPKLGTIGLWIGLHGESFLDAGMHHLECRFDFELLRDQLTQHRVTTMKPFSDLPFLRQAFTEGERWTVRTERAERLLDAGLITREQFDKFTTEGAIGSHLENLQRKGGFKGFNQKSVSVIIALTDPRKQTAHDG
jgi:hypothetical protein